ncbi:SDR family NAD(P)-dependent oxidoreductase [Paenibacillus xanthanilyticus]|uniref:SDR family NAD(P)-dependent oxidoreductase n=1 Tax=Paenibacillus xanthanilyticus TaxID=1783531 RepID=A0ABV8KDG7_9BACL
MLSILHNYANGLIAVPVLLACRQHGLFELLGAGQPVPFASLAQRLGANGGHLRTALAMLESLGWVERDDQDRYAGTDELARQRLIPADMTELLDFPMRAYVEGEDSSLTLANWASRAAAGWGIDDPLLAEFLDGMLFVPLITQLKGRADLDSRRASDPKALLAGLSGRVRDEVVGLLLAKGWLTRKPQGDELTELGFFLIDRMYNTAILYSYKPMLRQMNQVLFGDCEAVFRRGDDGHEAHIDRTLNVTGSGFQHEKYFADLEAAVLAIFDREPLDEQPDYIADMGCGDGTLLYRLHEMICAKSVRGRHLDRYPLRLIGIDYNEKALEATRETLRGLNPLTLTGDIGNPAKLMKDLAALGVDQPERILHVRSFLDHDRIYLPPAEGDGAAAHGVDEGIFVAADGREIPAGEAFRSLTEHLRKWADVVSEHGLLVLEVHNLKPTALRGQISKSESFHFDAFHRFSQQLLVEADQFLLAAAAAGLFPHEKYGRKYPKTLNFARITLNGFEPRGYSVRTASPADLDALEELERQCWDSSIRASRDTLAARIARYPMGQLVVAKEGRIVGSIYSQRIASADQLLRARIDDVESLHRPGGSVVQLLGIQVLPEAQNEGIGDQLLEFALQLASVTSGVGEAAGVSRCRDYAKQSELAYPQYVQARNQLGLPKDATLRFHEMHGARIVGIVPGYRPLDAANEGNGVLVRYDLRARRRYERAHSANAEQPDKVLGGQAAKTRDTQPYRRFLEATIKLMLSDPDSCEPHVPLMDMGLDSADLLELSEHINAKYGVTLGTTFFFKHGTVDKMAKYLSEHAAVQEAETEAPRQEAEQVEPHAKGNAAAAEAVAEGGIVLVGAACRLPGGVRDLESLWELLLEGRDAVSAMSDRWRWPTSIDPSGEHEGIDRGGYLDRIDEFDPAFFRMPASTAEWTDPQQRMLMELSWECLEHAGYPPSSLAGSRTGVYIGASGSDYHLLLGRSAEEVDARFGLGSAMSMLPNRISYYYDLLGPSLLIDTACSSSLVAVHEAVRAIRRGDCDQALVGAVHLMCDPSNTVSYYKAGMLSKEGACRTFDQGADGYVRGEGAAMLLLKPIERALADGDSILAVLEGTAVNHGGHASGLTVPNPSQQAALVKDALRDAGVPPERIGYVEAHGTGTPLGDPIEVSGLTEAFTDESKNPIATPYCGLGSIKTNIGHLEAAAGMAGLLKTVLAIRHRTLPANVHFNRLNREIDLAGSPFYVLDRAREWELAGGGRLRYAGVSSFGSGGTNAHVVLREQPEASVLPGMNRPAYLFALSAKTPEALARRIRDLGGWLRREAGRWTPEQVSSALAMGREHFQARKAYVAANLEELLRLLEQEAGTGAAYGQANGQEGWTPEPEQEGRALAAELAAGDLGADDYARGISRLADLYEAGCEVRAVMGPLFEGVAWRSVRLPAYPFARERYWLPKAIRTAQQAREEERAGRRDELAGQKGGHSGGNREALNVSTFSPAEKERTLEARVLDLLLDTAAELLNAERSMLGGDTELGEYGFDSILYLQLSRQLNGFYAFGLTPADFFTYSTLGRLASYLADQGGDSLSRRLSEDARRITVVTPPLEEQASFHAGESVPLRSESDAAKTESGLARAGISERAERTSSEEELVAIVGMSGVFPQARDVDEFWRNLLEGKDCIGELPRDRQTWFRQSGDSEEASGNAVRWGGFVEDIDRFDPLFFGISPKEAELMDPQQRLLLMHAWKALEDAGCNPRSLSGGNTAVFAGMMSNGYNELIAKSGHPIDGHYASGTMASVGPNRLSYFLNIHGPSEPVETACSSSLVAIYRAVQAIRSGASDLALAGGVNTLISPDYYESFIKAGMLSPDGRCKTFSAKADGYVRSEGAAMLVLKKLSAAERDGDHVYAVIRSAAVNHGGRASSLTAPNPRAQADLLVAAYAQSGIDPRTVTYIETHGTGTELGDPIEINGLKSAFRELYAQHGGTAEASPTCGLGSVKSNVGHLELAAGVAGVVKVLLQMKHKKRVKSLHCDTINPYIQLEGSPFYIVRQTEEWTALTDRDGNPIPRRAGISSFGFGGANAHLVLEEYVPRSRRHTDVARITPARPGIFVLSAKEEDRLREQAERLLAALGSLPEDRLADAAYTLQTGREAMEERLAIVAGSVSELAARLSGYLEGQAEGVFRGSARRAAQRQPEAEGMTYEPADLELLAASWVRGTETDWTRLYEADRRPSRIPLPTYPFARERCWVDPQPSGMMGGAGRAGSLSGALHPLVRRNTSTFAEQRYSTAFDGGEFYLRDHRVDGRKLLPGVAYLEMARAASSLASQSRTARLEDAVWIRPFYVDGGPRELHIRLQPGDEGRIACDMFSIAADGEEVLHAQAIAVAGELDRRVRPDAIDVNEMLRRCTVRTMNAEACYKLFDASALQYGPTFRGIDMLYVGDKEAIAKLTLRQETVSGTEEGFILHPGMMDTAIQACVGLLAEKLDKEPHPFLPFTAAAIEVFGGTAEVAWAHVRLAEGAIDLFDVALCDEQGRMLVYVRELVFMKAADGSRTGMQKAGAAVEGEALLAAPARGVPWDEASLATLAETEQTFAGLLWGQLHAAGFFEPGLTPARLLEKTSALRAPYDKWMRESLAVLARAGYLVSAGDSYVPSRQDRPDNAALWEQWRTHKTRWLADPDLAARVRLAESTLQALPDILAGAVKPTEILFPGGSMELVEGIYKHNAPADYYNAVVADVVEAYVQRSVEAGKPAVRILEVGAGTGGTSAEVLRRLQRYGARVKEYCYTDLSRAFLIHAEREYGAANPYLTYRILNAEQRFEEQALDCGEYDLVLATNVLHATRNVRRTLRHCKSALKKGGLLVLNELTEKSVFAHVTFGLLDGWWLYEEEDVRLPGSPCLSAEQWTRALTDQGYRNVRYAANDRGGQQIIWAESDGVIGDEAAIEQPNPRPELAAEPAMSAERNIAAVPPAVQPDAAADRLLKERCSAYIVQIVAEAVRLPAGKIDPSEPMERYGIDSILIVQVSNKLEKAFGHVGKTLLFEHRTIHELSDHFVQTRAETLRAHFGLAAAPAASAVQTTAAVGNGAGEAIDHTPASRSLEPKTTPNSAPAKNRFLSAAPNAAARASKAFAYEDEIAIVGLAGRYPGAANADEFWKLLSEGRSAIAEVPADRWDWRAHYAPGKGRKGVAYTKWAGFIDGLERFDSLLFQISPAEAAEMDPHERAFLEVAYECLEDAGYAPSSMGANGKVGVFVGVTHGASGRGSRNYSVANRVSYAFDLKGPSLAVDTACSSSLTALHLACDSLRSGSSDCAIAGGVNLIIKPDHLVVLSEFTMLSEGPECRAFGDGADGFVDGEGVGAVLLKPLARAIADGDHVYGVVKGSMINAGGRTNGYTVPNPAAHAKVIEGALETAGVKADEVSYIEAHGTGTALGDPIEVRGLTLAFRQHTDKTQYCALGSVKTNIGHGESAAGIAGLTKVLLQMKHGQLAPSLHSATLNPDIDFPSTPFRVQRELAAWHRPEVGAPGLRGRGVRIAGISSFGAGGANAHVVISEYAQEETGSAGYGLPADRYVIPLSARSEGQLLELAGRLLEAIRQGKISDANLRDAAYTLQVGREPMEERLACVVGSVSELDGLLRGYLAGERQHVHRGQVKQNKELLALLQDEEALGDVVRSLAGSRNSRKLAALWARGFAVDWSLLYEGARPRRMSLPTYPFGGQLYPIWRGDAPVASSDAGHAAAGSAAYGTEPSSVRTPPEPLAASGTELASAQHDADPNQDAEALTLIPVWETVEATVTVASEAPGRTVMIGGNESVRLAVRRRYADAILLNVEPRASVEQLVDKLAGLGSIGRVLWAAPEEQFGTASDERLIDAQEEGTLAAFRVVKAMLELGYGTKELAWIWLTWQSQQVRPDEQAAPHHAGIHGLAGVMAKEYPFWKVVSLDLEGGAVPDLDAIPASAGGQGCFARRGNQWYRQRLIPQESPAAQPAGSAYRHGGVYVVIGGAGGIGEAWTEYMIRRYRAQIAWIGRREEDEAIRGRIRELSRFGPAPFYVSADASDRAALEDARAIIRQRFGAINGIVHSAIVMLDQGLMRMEEDRFRASLAAKIDVSVRLAQVFGRDTLDFVLFFSSVNSFMRAAGQSNYVAGCLFKDMFARALGREWPCPVKVMNWGYWGTVGIVASDIYRDRLAQSGLASVTPEEGMRALEALLSGPFVQAAFMKCNSRFKFELIDRRTRLSFNPAAGASRMEAMRRRAGSARLGDLVQPKAVLADSRAAAQLEAAILELAAAGMGVDRSAMDADASLAEQGIDPVAWVQLLGRLSEELGARLTALPEDVRLTLREAAAALGERHGL